MVLLVSCLAFTLVLKIWRGSLESSIWMDEVFSLELATKPLPVLVDLAAQDVHPPMYYLALHSWLGIWEAMGMDPSILVARALNIVAWALLVLAAFLAMRKRTSPIEAAVGCTLVGLLPGAVQLTQDARSYGMALLGTTVAFLVVAVDLTARTGSRRPRWVLWLTFAAAALLATSSHHLSWLLLAAMLMGWLVSTVVLDGVRLKTWVAPIAGFSAVAVLSAPWLLKLSDQTNSLTEAAPTWMTAPTTANLARVFAVWIPLGRDGGSLLAAFPWLWPALGCCWASLPVLVLGLRRDRDRRLFVAGIAGMAVAFLYTASLWSLSRFAGLPVFHGPRYPLLVSGIWASAIWLLAASATRSPSSLGSAAPWIATCPWIACGLASLFLTTLVESRSTGSINAVIAADKRLHGGFYYTPSELGPFFSKTLVAAGAAAIPESPCRSVGPDSNAVLVLSRWRGLDTPESLLFHSAVQQGQLGEVSRESVPTQTKDFELIHMEDSSWQARLAETVCPAAIRLQQDARSAGTTGSADLGAQRFGEGWSYLEFDRKLRPFRWTNQRLATLRFRSALSPGPHVLGLAGRLRVGETMRVAIPSAGFESTVEVAGRDFDLSIPFDVPAGADAPTIVVLEAPVEVVQPSSARSYPRTLGILIRHANLEEAGK